METDGNELFEEVKRVIERDIRPFIEADGGKISLKGIINGVVYIQLSGACSGCPGAAMTLRGGVERILKMKIQDVKGVKLAY